MKAEAGSSEPLQILLYAACNSHLKVEYSAHFWSPPITRDIVNLHKVQNKSIQIIKELEKMPMGKGERS